MNLFGQSRFRALFYSLSLFLLGACVPPSGGGGSGSAVGDGGMGSVPPRVGPRGQSGRFEDDFSELAAEFLCYQAFECAGQAKLTGAAWVLAMYPTPAACQDRALELLRLESVAGTDAEVEAGLVRFSASKARDCLELLGRLVGTCENYSGSQAAHTCFFVARGTLESGERCTTDQQCESSYCDFEESFGDGCGRGTCYGSREDAPSIRRVGPGVEGDPCDSSSECVDALLCLDGVCREVRFGSLGDDCEVDGPPDFCVPGAVCLGPPGERGICSRPLGRGEACEGGRVCGVGLFCEQAASGGAGVCQPLGTSGALCSSSADCAAGLICDFETERCVARRMCPLPDEAPGRPQ